MTMGYGMNSDAADSLLGVHSVSNMPAAASNQNNRYLSMPQINASMDAGMPPSNGLGSTPNRPKASYVSPLYNTPTRGGLTVMRATAQDVSDDSEDSSKPVQVAADKGKIGAYGWFVMAVILAIRVVYQWQRSIFSYSYGYTGLGFQANNPIYEMATNYPELQKYFGLLTGFAYSIPFAGFGLWWGKMANNVNRKWMLGILMILTGVQFGIISFVDSFLILALMRPLLGLVSSAFNPLSFSLLADYFPPERRTTANSILQSGNYMGWGVSSLSVLAIKKFGWRYAYGLVGAFAAAIGLLTIGFVKEPIKKVQDAMEKNKKANEAEEDGDIDYGYTNEELTEMKDKPFKYMLSNPVNFWVMLGSFVRNIGGSVTTYFLPVFYLKCFAAYKTQYSFVNSVILSGFGLLSGVLAGIIADKYESKSKMTKAYICIVGCAAALPLMAVATLQTSNFWLSMVCFAIQTLLSAAFSGSAITMMQTSSPKAIQGSVISAYFAQATIAQSIGPLVCGELAKFFGATQNPTILGPLICALIAFGYTGSVPIWWKAGKAYEKRLEEKAERAKARLGTV